jgi:anti-sigma B factor antagonist
MKLADLQMRTHDDVLVARVTGEIDKSNATELRTAITETMPNDSLGVLLDLSNVDYIDSAGIHLLYRLSENLRNRGQTLRVVIPRGSPADDTLRLAGVTRHVDVVRELEEGLHALSTSTSDR